MAKTTRLKITTPNEIFFDGDIIALNLKTKEGALTILPEHSAIVSNIDVCKMTISLENHQEKICSIGSGLISADKSEINIITDDIIAGDKIDIKRAETDKEKALAALKKYKNTKDEALFELKLRKAINRIEIYNNNK
ncbi:ATP synthase F1 subunit epsilon [Mycoplasmopsis gallinarum]|uniref:ATP synthase F1 subunit epsilon n=1 Tax=Mycoplasmopsis gallinarum TaxID=29557 RepID=UPI00048250EE|nr:ATP synthase F1 subunit epsilon [Mycoplasmopsis gallinarum]